MKVHPWIWIMCSIVAWGALLSSSAQAQEAAPVKMLTQANTSDSTAQATKPCGGVVVENGKFLPLKNIPIELPLSKETRLCLDDIARLLGERGNIRSLTVVAQARDEQRLDGLALKVAEEAAKHLQILGVPEYKLSKIAPMSGPEGESKLFFFFSKNTQRRPVALLNSFTGQVFSGESPDEMKSVQRGETFAVHDWIATGSSSAALLDLADGSTVRLQAETQLRISGLTFNDDLQRQVQLELVRGTLETIVKPGKVGSSFEIKTRIAAAAVRGTTLRVNVDSEGLSRLETLTGAVTLSGSGGEVLVESAQGSRVGVDGVPEPPRALLPPLSVLSPLAGDVSSASPLLWRSHPKAGRYFVEIARDPDFLIEVQRIAIKTPPYTLDSKREVGKWFWRVTAEDPDGFVGLPSRVHAFELRP